MINIYRDQERLAYEEYYRPKVRAKNPAREIRYKYKMSRGLSDILDKIIASHDDEYQVRVHLDVSGTFTNIFDDSGRCLLANLHRSGNNAYANAVFAIADSWIKAVRNHNRECVFVAYGEYGESKYHNDLVNESDNKYTMYKEARRKSRKGDNITQEVRDMASAYVAKQYKLIKKLCSGKDGKLVPMFSNDMEMDLIPHFIIRNRDTLDKGVKYIDIMLTSDKDNAQSLIGKTSYAISRVNSEYIIRNYRSCAYWTHKDLKFSYPASLASIALTVLGDTSDSITGLAGVGNVKVGNFFTAQGKTLYGIMKKHKVDSHKAFWYLIERNLQNHMDKVTIDNPDLRAVLQVLWTKGKGKFGKDVTAEQIIQYNRSQLGISYKMVDFDSMLKHIKNKRPKLHEELLYVYNNVVNTKLPQEVKDKKFDWVMKTADKHKLFKEALANVTRGY